MRITHSSRSTAVVQDSVRQTLREQYPLFINLLIIRRSVLVPRPMAATLQRRNKRVAVVGAGVVGLNSALEVQRRFPDADVAVIAHKFNGETLSDGAAGLLRPDSYIFGPDRQVSQ